MSAAKPTAKPAAKPLELLMSVVVDGGSAVGTPLVIQPDVSLEDFERSVASIDFKNKLMKQNPLLDLGELDFLATGDCRQIGEGVALPTILRAAHRKPGYRVYAHFKAGVAKRSLKRKAEGDANELD